MVVFILSINNFSSVFLAIKIVTFFLVIFHANFIPCLHKLFAHFHTKMEFTCTFCRSEFQTKREMLDHRKECTKKEKPYCCQYCPKRFGRLHHRKDHENLHMKKLTCYCPLCGKGYVQKSNLKNHLLHCTSCPVTTLKNKLVKLNPNFFVANFSSLVRGKPPKVEDLRPSINVFYDYSQIGQY